MQATFNETEKELHTKIQGKEYLGTLTFRKLEYSISYISKPKCVCYVLAIVVKGKSCGATAERRRAGDLIRRVQQILAAHLH